MRHTLFSISAATLAALISASCTKQEHVQPISEETVVLSVAIESGTKTFLDSALVKWSAGDAVTVFSTTTNKSAFTLTSGTGTTSAQFSGQTPSGSTPYFMIYPHNEANTKNNGLNFIVPQNQTYAANSFGNGAFPMYGSFASFSDPVEMKNLFGGIKFQFTGKCTVNKIILEDLDGKSLWGTAKLAINNKQGTDAQTITFTNGGSSVNLICPDGVKLDETTPTAFFIAVPAGSFSNGLKVTVYDGSTEVGSFSTSNDKTISRNSVRVFKSLEITGIGGGPTDLSAIESANCYIVNDGGQYKFKTVKGNGSDTLTVTSVEVLWETVNTMTAPAVGTVVKNPSYADNYINFTATGTPGNALIAAKNGETIVWSWHIWVPSTKVTKAAYSNGKVAAVMDRNLGALVTTAGDAKSNGLLYQFGRKDPFMGSAAYTTANTPIASTGTFTQETITSSTNIDYANAHPTVFILQGTGKDWLVTGSKNNWSNATKTIYDPCPPGYRVAPNTTWDDLAAPTYANYSWTVDGIHNYPITGQIKGDNGVRAGHSNGGYIWNRNSGDNQGQMLLLTTTAFTPKKSGNRSWALAMRCCSDTAPTK